MRKAYFERIDAARKFAKQKQAQGYWVSRNIECIHVPVNPELFIADIPTATRNLYAVVYKDKAK